MPRAISQVASRNRRKKVLKEAKGHRQGRRNQIKAARLGVLKGMQYAYRDRRVRKREFRALWITRIGAAAKQEGLSYSKLMGGLTKAGIEINRKMLSELAIHDPDGFRQLVETARTANSA